MTNGGRDSDPLATTVASEVAAGGDPTELVAGERIGRYVIVRRLGAGGMGVVYEAHDPQLDRKVAIKLVHPRRALDPTNADRLLREARALARLRHPGVVAVHDVGWAGERLFVAMELIDGTSLGDLLRARDPASLADWPRWLALVCEAGRGLAAAHAAGILHRDFKPDNVLVANDGRVCVGDFGLAELSEDADVPPRVAPAEADADARLTTTGAVVGTPAYMAPEQHRGQAIDARADQFAFCVTLWEALFDERPFDPTEAVTVPALATEVIAGRVRRPPPRHGVPAWLEQLVRRGLEPDPAARFASMDELVDAIERRRRRPRRLALIAAIVVGAVVVAGVAAVVARRDSGDPPRAAVDVPPRALAELTISADAPLTPLVAIAPDAGAVLFITNERVTAIRVPDGRRTALVVPAETQVVGGYLASSTRAVLSLVDADGSGSLASWDLIGPSLDPITPLPSPIVCVGAAEAAQICLDGTDAAATVLALEGDTWRSIASLSGGELARVSPRGTRVAFSRSSPPALIVVELGTGAMRTHEVPVHYGVAWSDEDHLLYGDLQGGEIGELDLTTGTTRARRVRPDVAMIRPLGPRGDGRALALTTTRSTRTRVLALDGGAQHELQGPIEALGWTARGELITLDLETFALAALDPQDRSVPFGALPDSPLDVSVAGELLITLERVEQTCALVGRALADGAERWRRTFWCGARLTCAGEATAPCLVLYPDGAGGVWWLDPVDGSPTAVPGIHEARFPISALAPGGEVLAGVADQTVHLQPLDGGAARSLPVRSDLLISSLAYGGDGRLFVVAADLGTGARGLYAADTTGDHVELTALWESAGAELRPPRISPDGAAAAFVEVGYQHDLVELALDP